MICDEIAMIFNGSTERKYWDAKVGGGRLPVVYFRSASSMVELTYYPQSKVFAIAFTKVQCSFGDFMYAAHSALTAVVRALKAGGYPVEAPIEADDGVVRMEYDPRVKTAYVSLAKLGDDWQDYTVAPEPRTLKAAPVSFDDALESEPVLHPIPGDVTGYSGHTLDFMVDDVADPPITFPDFPPTDPDEDKEL
jgi:hypothetical protein